jgi:hypothetical protein
MTARGAHATRASRQHGRMLKEGAQRDCLWVYWRMRIASKGFRELRRDVGGGQRGRRGIVRIAGEKRDVSYDSFVESLMNLTRA